MGDNIEQWRARIGQWSGGRPRQCVILQHCIAQTSNHACYRLIRFLVLVSLLIIGCVELNPGPNQETSASPQTASARKKFHRRPGTKILHGAMYEIKMAAFLFARALHKSEEFYLASNVEGAGAFDDLVFRYRLREPDVWKTCFIDLKHKKSEGTIKFSSLIQISGDFSLFKYFESYCKIKREYSTDSNLKHFGPFDDFEFLIYTNARMEKNFPLQEGDSDSVSILSSGTNDGLYVSFDEKRDKDSLNFFNELSEYYGLIVELSSLLKRGSFVDKEINKIIEKFQSSITNKEILDSMNSLKSTLRKVGVTRLIKDLAKYDFTLFKEFLSKVKIFQNQSNEISFKQLIVKELQDACKASTSVANSIYTKYEEGFSEWWSKDGNVVWLKKDSHLWQEVEKYLIREIKEITEPDLQEIVACGVSFKQQHIQRLCDAIEQNTFLNIVTNSNIRNLHKLKTYQALDTLGYRNSLFIGLKSLMIRRKEIRKLWPCKWSAVLVIDYDYDGNVADTLLDILQQSVDCEQGLDISGDIMVETLVDVLQKYQQKVILISTQQNKKLASLYPEKLRSVFTDCEDNFNMSDLDEKSQNKILKRTVNFQGINTALQTLVGTDPPECIKALIDSDVISILLSNEHKLCVGRYLSDLCYYYVPRILQHHIYLKKEILKLADKTTIFAISGLETDELKEYLTADEKICEFIYDEKERNYFLKIVADYSNVVLSAERETMKAHPALGQKMKSDVKSVTFGNKNTDSDFSESIKVNPLRTLDNFSTTDLSAELENMKASNKIGQKINPEELRYIILGIKNPESKFRELKELCANVHWIHVEEGSLLWRDSNCNIDIIRRYIDNTKCKKYDIESIMEQSDKTMLLVAEPGMGKSTFLSNMEHAIKKCKPSVWVLRINLHEHARALGDTEFEEEYTDQCKTFLWNAAHSQEQVSLRLVQNIFLQALEETGKMVIILDAFDEISPYYTPKVNVLIRAIREKTASQIVVSSRFTSRQALEDIVIKMAFTLQPFTLENQIEFLEHYWKKEIKGSKEGNLHMFAEKLLILCSQNLGDKDREFTGIPLQTMMLGEAFVKEAVYYCSKGDLNLPEKFNLIYLFKKFWEKKCDIYYSEKNAMDSSKPEVKCAEKSNLQKHMIAALISLFSLSEIKGLLGKINVFDLEQVNRFLQSEWAERFGIIREMKDGKPHFVHRCFAEYFAAKWFADNFIGCEDFISDTLFNTSYEVTRNIFDRMLAEDCEIHGAVFNNDISAVEEFMKKRADINFQDKGGRTALHLAASYNRPIIQKLLSFPGVEANKPDAVLKWTPLRYAKRTKSWMAMDNLLQSGAIPDDIVLIRRNIEAQEWGQEALWECASKGYEKLLEFMLSCGSGVDTVVEVTENIQEKGTLLHIASVCGQVEVVRHLVDRNADINIRNAERDTALHKAVISGSVEIIKILLDKGMSVDLTKAEDSTPLHFSAHCDNLEATKYLVERGAAVNSANKYGNTPLLLAARNGKLEVFLYLTEIGADLNIRNADRDTALHQAAISGSVGIIKILLDKGMSVNLTNAEDSTPLHISAHCGNLEATKTFIERGAALNSANKYGDTPLHLATRNGRLEVFRYLREMGAVI